MNPILRILRAWLPTAVAATALSLLVYASAQQVLRQGADDPQIQMAQDAAAALDAGQPVDAVGGKVQVDMARSLAPFVVVYDASGKPLAGTGALDGKLPDYPIGALEAAKGAGENRVTWRPRPDVRIASVVVPYKDGYVVAGRSLREVEKRESQMGTIALAGWLAAMLGSLVAAALVSYR